MFFLVKFLSVVDLIFKEQTCNFGLINWSSKLSRYFAMTENKKVFQVFLKINEFSIFTAINHID